MTLAPTPEGMLRRAWDSPDLIEVFVHPETADELCRQSGMGVLRFDGRLGHAAVVNGPLGNGDLIVRVIFEADKEPLPGNETGA